MRLKHKDDQESEKATRNASESCIYTFVHYSVIRKYICITVTFMKLVSYCSWHALYELGWTGGGCKVSKYSPLSP
jgi:hypothetical protein